MPRITRRPDGLYTARVSLTYADGRRAQPRVYGTTRREVEDAILRLQHEHRAEPLQAGADTPLGDYIAQWLPRYRESGHSQFQRRTVYELHVAPDPIARIPISDLRRRHVQDFIERKADQVRPDGRRGYARAYIDGMVRVISLALDRAVADELLRVNPCAHVQLPPARRRPPHVWSAAEVRRCLTGAADDPLHALWTLALVLGIRRGELLALRWADVDLARGRLTIARTITRETRERDDGSAGSRYRVSDYGGKTPHAHRTLVLPPRCLDALRAHRERQRVLPLQSVSVFPAADGDTLGPSALGHHWRRLLARLGLRYIRPHDMRHTAATHMLQQGVPLAEVARILGHANPSITMRLYAHALESATEQTVNALERLYEQG